MKMPDNILYVPIQINGGGYDQQMPDLLERELYVLEDGVLYVGCKNRDGSIQKNMVMGRIYPGADVVGSELIQCKLKQPILEEVYDSADALEKAIEDGNVLEGQLCFFTDQS